MHYLSVLLLAALCLSGPASLSLAAQDDQQASLTKADAAAALAAIDGEVMAVNATELPGIYQVNMKFQDRIVPLYLDETGSYLISGNLIRLEDRKNLTQEALLQLNPIAFDSIPLDDALLLGSPEASQKMIVFTDPGCPYCSKLHKVMKQAVAENPELAFYIKLLSLKPNFYRDARTILCNSSLEQLEMAFAGEHLPTAECDDDSLEKNRALAKELGISGTPTLILPNGQLAPGHRPLPQLLELIATNQASE